MPNVLLTEKCVRACPYCFAKKHMEGSVLDDTLSWDNLLYVADFFEASGEKQISLLGGEPTLHPDFVDYVVYLIERGFHVNVFTSGILSDQKLTDAINRLTKYSTEQLSYVCNMNHPSICTTPQQERMAAFLEAFGKYSAPGFNIYQPKFEMEFLADAINRYGMKRHIRLGLAHPIPGEVNAHVTIADMPAMIDCLLSFEPLFKTFNMGIGFDCGFPLCVLSDDRIGRLFKLNNGRVTFGCGPAIDIGTDMSVWCCFPLSNFHKKSLYDFNTLKEIVEYYRDLHKKIRIEAGGIFEKCDACHFRETELCSGGCLAHIVSWFQKEAPVRAQEIFS